MTAHDRVAMRVAGKFIVIIAGVSAGLAGAIRIAGDPMIMSALAFAVLAVAFGLAPIFLGRRA